MRAVPPPRLSFAAAVERALIAARGPGRTVLGITGPPGAGKSTVVAALADAVDRAVPGSVVVVGMDAWHLAHSVLVARGDAAVKGAPVTFDPDGYVSALRRVRTATGVVWLPEFRREIEDAVAGAVPVVPEHRLVLTEGNYLLLDGPWAAVRPLLDVCWYVEVHPELRLARLAERHRSFGCDADEADRRVRVVDEANAELVRAARDRADALLLPDGVSPPA